MPSKILSLKLQDAIFNETEEVVKNIHKARNAYINEAVDFYNKLHRRKFLKKQLAKESKLVSKESMEVLHEFEAFMEQ